MSTETYKSELFQFEQDAVLAEEEIKPLASGLHGVIATTISSNLFNFTKKTKLGWVMGDNVDFDLPGLGTKIKKPDAAFVSRERMPVLIDDTLPFAPDLAVEVLSRTDSWKELVTKVQLYFHHGTRLVWVVDPYTKSVFVFHPNQPIQTLTIEDELKGETVLPDFVLPVSEIFDYPIPEEHFNDVPSANQTEEQTA
jgi:Uma2 family endonuclease